MYRERIWPLQALSLVSIWTLLSTAFLLTMLFIFYIVFFSPVLHNIHDIGNHPNGGAGLIEVLRQENIIRVRRGNTEESLNPGIKLVANDAIEKLERPILPGASFPFIKDAEKANDFGHPILLLKREELESTPVSVMMKWYGEALGGGTCNGDFGNSLAVRWRHQRERYCGTEEGTEHSHRISSIDCFLVRQTRHHGNGDQLCEMKNVSFDIGKVFNNDKMTAEVVKRYVKSRHVQQPYVPFSRGFLKADCDIVMKHKWKIDYMPGWNADFTVKALETVDTAALQKLCKVDGSRNGIDYIPHNVLIQQRDTFANFFHDSEDFFNVFLSMAILEWVPRDTQVFLTDLYPRGPFWDIWSRVFSHGNLPAMTAWDIKNKYNGSICFQDVAIGIYGPAAPMTVASWDTPCKKTALVRAYSDFIIRGMNLERETHYAQALPSSDIVITYMARRPSAQWPERKYCDTENSFFRCSLWDGFGQRKLGRMIRNDMEVVAALKELEQKDYSQKKIRKVIVNNVDYNVLSFEEQLRVDLQTDIMIGPHGAGLMHNIFMRERAMLIELFIDGSNVNRHFHNMAFWFGRPYRGVVISNPIVIPTLLKVVEEAIDTVAENIDNY